MMQELISLHIRTERLISFSWLVSTMVVLAACSPSESNVSLGNRTGVLYYGIGSEVQTLDPHVVSDTIAWEISGALFEGLIRHDPETMQPEPGVAQSWDISDDGMTVVFHLNPQARWSNGDSVTAEDFVWSWRRSLHPAMGNVLIDSMYPIKNAEPYSKGLIEDPEALGVRALGPHTLQVELENPTPHLFSLLDSPIAAPVHRPTIEAHGAPMARYTKWTRVENMVSNGPFRLAQWKMYRFLRVERSETYWDANNVALNAIVFKPVDSDTVEEKMFRAGQLHVTYQLPVTKIPAYKAVVDSPYVEAPLLGSYYYLFNIDRPPVDDIRVREALSLAIDRDLLVEKVLLGTERPSASMVPAGIPGYAAQQHAVFNPDRARELLAEAGYPDGAGWPGLELFYNTSENHRRIAVAAQQMWKEHLNLDIELTNQEWKVYLDTVDSRKFRMARMSWIGSFPGPGTFLDRFVTGGASNRIGFSSERYDELIQQIAPKAKSRDLRFDFMSEAEKIFMQEVPVIPLYNRNGKHLVQPSVQGYYPNILEYRNFKQVSLDPDAGVWQWPSEDE
ncbi:MAG: peptide ABC transporter substrate-binding protein [Halioglobus sp.]